MRVIGGYRYFELSDDEEEGQLSWHPLQTPYQHQQGGHLCTSHVDLASAGHTRDDGYSVELGFKAWKPPALRLRFLPLGCTAAPF
ncbi:hypothetical protein AVEN_261198-1 [Araneus ventricosus]|uniref:Uncharacterized protein n=1 Tax=Araneus ventricosus TaxID=182803 RepID=A0A4Y2W4M6_ARAVE|nr:hypothetical protein AVEN_261198-1 [Araneus ventricosus]